MDTFLGIAGLLVGIAGLIIAWFQYEGKRKLTHAFQSALKGMTGNIAKIQQSTNRKAFSVRIKDALGSLENKNWPYKSPLMFAIGI